MARASLTTKTNKAKCLAYRNGKRCGRVAIVLLPRSTTARTRCASCAEGHEAREVSPKGFRVVSTEFSGWVTREYKRIN